LRERSLRFPGHPPRSSAWSEAVRRSWGHLPADGWERDTALPRDTVPKIAVTEPRRNEPGEVLRRCSYVPRTGRTRAGWGRPDRHGPVFQGR
jgi:hypothetical protein